MLQWFFQTLYRLPSKICCIIIHTYRLCISPWIGPRCRFYPSCSQYALEALKTHSFFVALWIILRRLLKCHPYHPGGCDPVPLKPAQRKKE